MERDWFASPFFIAMKIQFVQPYLPFKPGDVHDTETVSAIGLIQMNVAQEYQDAPSVSKPPSPKRTATLKKPSKKR